MTGGEREVVKLNLGEGGPTLNVLPVGLDGETLTLVCPFPALPMDMPVSVTLPGIESGDTVEAKIRRVSVEPMGDAALPRFKLQLEVGSFSDGDIPIMIDHLLFDEKSSDEIDVPFELSGEPEEYEEERVEEEEEDLSTDDRQVELFEFSSKPSVVVEEHVEHSSEPSVIVDDDLEAEAPDDWEDEDWKLNPDESWSVDEYHLLGRMEAARQQAALLSWGAEESEDEDPPWVTDEEDKVEIVRADLDDSRHHRTRWPVRMAVSLALVVSIFAIGYVMRGHIASFIGPFTDQELSLAAISTTEPAEEVIDAPLGVPEEREIIVEEEEPTVIPLEEEVPTAPPTPAAEEQPAGSEPSFQLASTEEELSAPHVDGDNDQLRVVLPTRWPVAEARSYRLNDPLGIVIDVPGGMASERARWIDTDHDRVRSVRVLERNEGVRFIIYLTDEVIPRYRISYNRNGVFVDILGPDPRHVATK